MRNCIKINNITQLPMLLILLTWGVTCIAELASFSDGRLTVPSTCIPQVGVFDATLELTDASNNIFELKALEEVFGTTTCNANFQPNTNLLKINHIDVKVGNADIAYEADLLYILNSNPIKFTLARALELKQAPITPASFAGIYDGIAVGNDGERGTFSVQISIAGGISGSVFFPSEEEIIALIGNVNEQGNFIATIGTTNSGGTFTGNITGNDVQGTWENRFFGTFGTFSGTKRI